MWLTRLALRNPVLILMVSLMVLFVGLFSLRRLSVDLFPEINIPVVRVATFYPGAGPRDIEKSITQPIERAVAAAPGVDRIESVSRQGVSIVSAWFHYDTNLDNAQFEVQQRVSLIQNTLPPGIAQPFIIKFDITNIPVLQINISSDELDEKALYDLAYNVIEPQVERISGVASAQVGGGKQREIEVRVDPDRLRARGLDILDVVAALRANNLLLPSGSLRTGQYDFNVFTNTQVASPSDLEDVIVKAGALLTSSASPALQSGFAAQGAPSIRIRDVATVRDGTADQTNIVRIDGTRGVYLRVQKQPGANTIRVVDAVKESIKNLRGVPPSVRVVTSFDQSQYIRAAITALEHEALQGGLLAIIVILVFLASGRGTLIVSIAIPLSIIATFVLLYFTKQTINVFTLGGLALGVGRLVDDSIVELENIHRHLATDPSRTSAVLKAAQEVAMPILVSTVTTIVVFFPVLFLTGVARNLFIPLALTISFSLVVSFFVSRTVTPVLCLRWLPHEATNAPKKGRLAALLLRSLDALDHAYARALRLLLRARIVVVVVSLACFFGSLLLLKKIGTEFFPQTDESQLSVIFRGPIGTRVEKSEQLAERLERRIEKALAEGGSSVLVTQLSDVGLPGGRTALFTSNSGQHTGNIGVNLVSPSKRAFRDIEAQERIRKALGNDFPGTQVYFFVGGIVKRILNFGASAPIDIEIVGFDLEEGSRYAKSLLPKLRGLADDDGRLLLTDVQVSREENYPELNVVVDRLKAGGLGITELAVSQTVLSTLVGNTSFAPIPFVDSTTGNQYFVNVKAADSRRDQATDLADIFIRAPSGAMVSLGSIATIDRSSGPVQIARKYLQRTLSVTANIAPDKDLGTASAAVMKVVTETPPPDGFSVGLSGQTQAQKEAFSGLGLAGLMAIALVYMVLASQFRSLVDPLVIMFSVPLGISGVLLMLYVTGTTINVNSAMGVIMMIGIVVSNGVLLVDFANVLRRRGEPLVEATINAARTRLRPILMTTIATLVGLLPMAIGIGEGSETNLPLARAVIGGLSVSTFFTLFLIPSLYVLLDRFAKRTPDDAALATGVAE